VALSPGVAKPSSPKGDIRLQSEMGGLRAALFLF
jgi:hypothetical protein